MLFSYSQQFPIDAQLKWYKSPIHTVTLTFIKKLSKLSNKGSIFYGAINAKQKVGKTKNGLRSAQERYLCLTDQTESIFDNQSFCKLSVKY